MTIRSPTYLKGRFENGDTPSATDFEDIFDSYFSLATSASQTIEGRVTFQNQIIASEVISPLVSATSIIASFVSAQTVNAANISSTNVSAVNVSANAIYSSTANLQTVTANNAYLNNAYIGSKIVFSYSSAAAQGTTQASAYSASSHVTYVSTSETERALKISTHENGQVQYIVRNATGTAASIYPAGGCNFIGTAVNAPLLLDANITMQIIHVNSSAYAWMRY